MCESKGILLKIRMCIKMVVTALMVKELRQKTGAGMLDCKKALVETDGNIDKAIAFLREKGMASAAKKADRIAAEGLIEIHVNGNFATIIEINSETDFVAKNEKFVNLVKETAALIGKNKPANIDEALILQTTAGKNLVETFVEATAVIGEKIELRRFVIIDKADQEVFGAYKHAGNRIAVVTVLDNGSEKIAKDIAMHIAAMKPTVLAYTDLDSKFIEEEVVALRARIEIENEDRKRTGKTLKRIPEYASKLQLTDAVMDDVKVRLETELKAQGKPEQIWDKIIPGQLEKFIKDNTEVDQTYALLSQSYILDEGKTVEKYLSSISATIKKFIRIEVGEGIEKKEVDFAEEVMSQVRG